MSKITILFVIVSFSSIIFAQNDIAYYKEGVAYSSIFNEDMELVKDIPAGKKVSIKFDNFYNSYFVSVTTLDGIMTFDLRYSFTDNEGYKIYRNRIGSENSFFYLVDQLEDQGTLIILNQEIQEFDGNRFIYSFTFKNLNR